MNLGIRSEYFQNTPFLREISHNVSTMSPKLYPQSRDWTCSLACLRTITSGIISLESEDELIDGYKMRPGPYYSKDIKKLGILTGQNIDVIYGCDMLPDEKDVSVLWEYMSQGWRIMTDWLMSYDHWTVLLSYIKSQHGPDYDELIYYDPYCDEVLKIRNAHFSEMWMNTSGNIKDFIAVRAKSF